MEANQQFLFGLLGSNQGKNFALKDLLTALSEPIDLDQIEKKCQKITYQYARQTRLMYRHGRYDAIFGILDSKSKKAAHAKERHRLRGLAALEDVKAEIQKARAVLELNRQFVQRDKDDTDLLNKLEQYEKELALAEAEKSLLPLIVLYGKSDTIKKELDQYELKHDKIFEKDYSNLLPTKYLYDNPVGYWGICILIYCIEVVVTYPAVVNLGEVSNALALVFCVTISALLSVIGVVAGADFQKGKIWSGTLWGLAGLVICIIVMVLRMDTNSVMTYAVFVFFSITLLLSYAKAINYAFYQCKRQIARLKPKLDKALTKNAKIETAYDLLEKKINTQYEGQTGTLSLIFGRTLQQYIDAYTVQLMELEILQKQVEDRLNSFFIEGCLNYDRGYIFMSQVLFRRSYFEPSFNVTKFSKLADENWSANNGHDTFTAAKCLALLIAFTFFWSCTPPVTHDVTILIDKTHEHQIEPPELTEYVLYPILQLEEKGMRDAVRLTVSTIGETSKQRSTFTELPEGAPWITRRDVKRKQEIQKFVTEADSLIHEAMNTKDSLVYSFIHENTASHLNRLVALPATVNRHVVILSDMLIHTPELSVYRNPELLEDFTHLQSRLLNSSPLPSCNNVRIYIAHLPDRQTDALFSKSLTFFTRLYESHGAQMVYVPGL